MSGGNARLVVVPTLVACCVALAGFPALAKSAPSEATSTPNTLCAVPESLARLGESSQAHALYLKVLEADPTSACAAAGLRHVDQELQQSKLASSEEDAQALCDQANAYRHAHRSSDATDAYKAALAKEPAPGGCAAHGLNETSPGWLSRAAEWIGSELPALLVGLGVLFAAGLLILMIGYLKKIGGYFKRLPGIRYILRGRLSLGDCDDSGLAADMKVGKVLSAGIRERLQRFREEAVDPNGIAYGLDFGTGTENLADIVSDDGQLSSALAKLGEASEHTKLIAAVVGALIAALPIKRLAVSAVLEPAATSEKTAEKHFCPAAKLFIARGAKLVAATSLSGRVLKAPPVAGDYLQLSAPAAVWVQYEVARELSDVDLKPDEAQSYALVREGLDYHYAERYDEAEEAYESALQLDPSNWAAHVNLAMTKARGAHSYGQARAILQRALAEMTA